MVQDHILVVVQFVVSKVLMGNGDRRYDGAPEEQAFRPLLSPDISVLHMVAELGSTSEKIDGKLSQKGCGP